MKSLLADAKVVILRQLYDLCKAIKPVVNHNLCTDELANINTLVRVSEENFKKHKYFDSDVKGYEKDFDVYTKG